MEANLNNFFVFAMVALFSMFNEPIPSNQENMAYNEFLAAVDRGEVSEVNIQQRDIIDGTQNGTNITGSTQNGVFKTYISDDSGLIEHLLKKNVMIVAKPPAQQSFLVNILVSK